MAKQPLTRDQIVKTALKLADRRGIDGLSMRKLGDALKVEAMSLYHHIPNKDALLDAMVDRVFAEVGVPDAGSAWKPSMRQRAESLRAALLRHPWALGLTESRKAPGPATLRHHNSVLGSLRGAGFSVALAAHAFSVMDSYIYGFVLQELHLPFTTGEEAAALAGELLAALPASEYPHLAEMASKHVMRKSYSYQKEFQWGLGLVLDGLERELKGG